MTDSERLKAIEQYTGCTTRALAINIGLKQPQTLYDIHKGKHGFSKAVASAIQAAYLNINIEWILYGEGDMLKSSAATTGSTNIFRDNNNSTIDNRQYYSNSPDVLRAQIDVLEDKIAFLDAQIKEKDAQIKEKDAQIKEKDAQIKQLLDILATKK